MMMIQMILNNINAVMKEYNPDESIWRDYNDDVLMLKQALKNLSDADRVIFVLYCEYGSLRKVGKQLGVSHSIIYKNITRIKREMYDYIRVNCNNEELIDRLRIIVKNTDEDELEEC